MRTVHPAGPIPLPFASESAPWNAEKRLRKGRIRLTYPAPERFKPCQRRFWASGGCSLGIRALNAIRYGAAVKSIIVRVEQGHDKLEDHSLTIEPATRLAGRAKPKGRP